ncbi:hypothetical protein LRAMOSA07039 [Lichtheimia ramosa]|uniref:Golgi apparatus membrane protein TVP38 n=1 Tax=Lichtheimia ramosa TaxID=688394 RepID=A0A077WBW6_9FUNG|nr:hypothetical protein LRAMOSA07039 [Lichtheimia ramosa]
MEPQQRTLAGNNSHLGTGNDTDWLEMNGSKPNNNPTPSSSDLRQSEDHPHDMQTFWFSEQGSMTNSQRARRILGQLMDRRQLWQLIKDWRWAISMFLLSWIMGMIMYSYRHELYTALEDLSNLLRDMGFGGYLLLSLLIFLSAFPPMIGYGTYQTLSGFTFGFAQGFPVSYFSALLGSVVCFVVSRLWLKGFVTRLMARYPNLKAVVHAVEKKGFKLFLLIRLSPYPFNLLNVLFAATNISLRDYTIGTALTLTKIALHVYIGANLTSFAKQFLDEEDDSEMTDSERRANTARTIAMIIGSVLATCVMIYIYIVAKRAVKEVEQEEQQDDQESLAFLSRQAQEDHDDASLEDWMEWHEDDDHSVELQARSRDVERG